MIIIVVSDFVRTRQLGILCEQFPEEMDITIYPEDVFTDAAREVEDIVNDLIADGDDQVIILVDPMIEGFTWEEWDTLYFIPGVINVGTIIPPVRPGDAYIEEEMIPEHTLLARLAELDTLS